MEQDLKELRNISKDDPSMIIPSDAEKRGLGAWPDWVFTLRIKPHAFQTALPRSWTLNGPEEDSPTIGVVLRPQHGQVSECGDDDQIIHLYINNSFSQFQLEYTYMFSEAQCQIILYHKHRSIGAG